MHINGPVDDDGFEAAEATLKSALNAAEQEPHPDFGDDEPELLKEAAPRQMVAMGVLIKRANQVATARPREAKGSSRAHRRAISVTSGRANQTLIQQQRADVVYSAFAAGCREEGKSKGLKPWGRCFN
jgi:hypothetical protein